MSQRKLVAQRENFDLQRQPGAKDKGYAGDQSNNDSSHGWGP
jgi:hypothetical protein